LVPHEPQLFGSARLTHAPPQHIMSPIGSVHACPSGAPAQEARAQYEPWKHVSPAGQAAPPAPQVWAQLPLRHAEPPAHVWPQPPQLFVSAPNTSAQLPPQHNPGSPPPFTTQGAPWGAEAQLETGHCKPPTLW
jgi:hypothetical protein